MSQAASRRLVVSARVSQAVYDGVRAAARAKGMPRAEYLRHILKEAVDRDAPQTTSANLPTPSSGTNSEAVVE